jgi:dihydropteroate synthase
MAVERGAHVIRTHDVAETRDAALVGDALARDRLRSTDGDVTVEELDVTTDRELARHLARLGDDGTAGNGTTRVFELGGLSPAERDRLADAARGTGATVAGDVTDGRRLLVGTAAAIVAVADAALGESESLDAALTTVARVVD